MKLRLEHVRYLGLQKVAAMTSARDTVQETTVFDAGFHAVTPKGGWRREAQTRPEWVRETAFLRSRAADLITQVSAGAPTVMPGSEWNTGLWYQVAGAARYVQTFHDDFRGEDDRAPRVAAWIFEIPDPAPDTVTWLVLHGSVDGNMFDTFDAGLPAKRAGSGTEALFEFLFARGNGAELRTRRYEDEHRPAMLAWAVHEMFNSYSNHRLEVVEALFRVTDVLDPGPAVELIGIPLVSLHGLSPRSERIGGVAVSQVIIGTPLVVQTYPPSPPRGLLQRLLPRRPSIPSRFDAGLETRDPELDALTAE